MLSNVSSNIHVFLISLCLLWFSSEERQLNDKQGPVFIYEPPNIVEFLNEKGTRVDCSAFGVPEPEITWKKQNGNSVDDIDSLRKIFRNGSIVFYPFESKSYQQEIHASVYICYAANRNGAIVSRPVYVRAVVNHVYEVQVYNEFVIAGNTAVLRCHIPSYVSGYASVISWIRNDNYIIRPQLRDIGGRYSIFPDGQLHIRNVMPSDGHWSFWCQTRHRLSGQTVRSSSAGKLIFTEPRSSVPPQVIDRKSVLIVEEKHTVEIPCAAQSHPLPQYRWFKFDENSEKYAKVNFSRRITQLSGSLFIRKVQFDDSGQYKCDISNSVGARMITTILKVNSPLVVFIEPQNQIIGYSQPAILNCTHSIQSEATEINWIHNGILISLNVHGKDYDIIRDKGRHSSLRIKSVRFEEEGMYQCMVKNNEGKQAQGTAQIMLGDTLPVIKLEVPNKIFHEGSEAYIECSAKGTPLPRIDWSRDGETLSNSWNTIITSSILNSEEIISRINVSDVKSSDGGRFRCRATNSAGIVSAYDRLNVHGTPNIRPLKSISIISGLNYTLNCYVTGYPLPSLHWQKDGKVLRADSRHTDYENGTVIIRKVSKELDQGRYTCVTKSSGDGHVIQIRHMDVKVYTEPVVMINPIASFKLNDRAVLTCVVTKGDQPVQKVWKKDNQTIASNLGLSMTDMVDFSTLLIPKLKPMHNGVYSCIGRNTAGFSQDSVSVQVQTPPGWIRKPNDKTVGFGEDVMFHCQASGFPLPRIKWNKLFNGTSKDVQLLKIKRITLMPNSSLLMRNLSSEDGGAYECLIKNGIGSGLKQSFTLSIGTKPKVSITNMKEVAITGFSVEIGCQIYSKDLLSVLWTKDENLKIINSSRTRQVLKSKGSKLVSTLTIQNVSIRDAGDYFCQAQGKYGSSSARASLTILELKKSTNKIIKRIFWSKSSLNLEMADKHSRSRINLIFRRTKNGNVFKNISVDPGGKMIKIYGLDKNENYYMDIEDPMKLAINTQQVNHDMILSNNSTFVVNSVKAANNISPINSNTIYVAVYVTCAICLILVVVIVALCVIRRHVLAKALPRGQRNADYVTCAIFLVLVVVIVALCVIRRHVLAKALPRGQRNAGNRLDGENSKDQTLYNINRQNNSKNNEKNHVYSVPTPSSNYYDDISPYATFQLPDCRMMTNCQQVEMKTFSNSQ